MNETRRALYDRLASRSQLTGLLASPAAIYHAVAPANATTPFVVFNRQSGDPSWQFDGAHIQSELWTVKAVHRASSASRAEDIAAQIDLALTDAPLSIDGRELLAIYRDSDVEYAEPVDGATFFHVGAMYRVQTTPDA